MQLNLFGFENIKRCGACKQVLSIRDFYTSKRTKDGFLWECKKCNIKERKKYYKKNKDKMDKYRTQWNDKNRDKIKGYLAKYRKKNKKKYIEKQIIRNKNKYNNDPIFRFKKNIRNNIYNAFYRNGFKKNTKTEYILSTDWETVKIYIQNQFIDDMSWDNFDKIHIDHKIPLAAASTEFEVIALNHYTNLQPMWAEDNLRKSDKYDPEDFKKYMEWYIKNIKPYQKK